jgi:hypothetical protein
LRPAPLYTLSHDILSVGPTKALFHQLGVIPASRENAAVGEDPDVGEVDAYVREVMQKDLGRPAAQRRFPVLG